MNKILEIFSIFLCFIIMLGVSCKPKISFLGSSVTAQGNGYVPALKKLYSQEFEFEGYGFGGIGINPCKFDIAFQNKPNIIIFDWSILDGMPLAEKYIRASILRSKIENAIPVYLIFPRLDDGHFRMINIIRDLSKQLNFSVIDLSKTFSKEELKTSLLRDNHHTTDLGGIKYAEKIIEFLNNTELKIPVDFIGVEKSVAFPKLQLINAEAFNYTEIFLNGEIFGLFHLLGPHGNYVNIYENGEYKRKILLFDSWCHFVRSGYWDYNIRAINGSIKMQVLNESFDRKMPQRSIDWSSIKSKLHLKEICYSGDLLKVIADGIEIFAKK